MRHTPLLLLAVGVLAGCGFGSKEASTQPPASNTGFFAIVASGGTHKFYLPARSSPTNSHAKLAVVDAAAPHGSSGLLHFVDLGVDGAPQAVGGNGQDVVAVDVSTPTVYFVDAATDTLRGRATLPVGSEPILASDNSSYSMGAAVDAARRIAWLSVSTGLLQYDLDSRLVTETINVPVPENFAYDPFGDRIVAPFYLCEPVASASSGTCVPYVHPDGPAQTDSLTILSLVPHRPPLHLPYTLVDPAAADTQAPLGLRPDAVAIDFLLGVAVVAVEEPSSLQVLDLDAFSSSGADATCSVPALVPPVSMPGPVYTEVAADPVTHLALAAQEYGDGLVFLDLAQARQGTVARLDVTMPPLPDGTPWVNRGDPHGAGTGIVGGRPYAFLVARERNWIARIDLTGVARVMAGRGTFGAQVAYLSVPAPP